MFDMVGFPDTWQANRYKVFAQFSKETLHFHSELCYAQPYSSAKDPVNMAGYAIENVLTGKVKIFHWHEVDGLPHDGSVTLIDVRDPREVRQDRMDGFNNIPLEFLRERMGGLDASKIVYICCHSGVRSYIAARILSQNGFDVYNLSGGCRLYNTIRNHYFA